MDDQRSNFSRRDFLRGLSASAAAAAAIGAALPGAASADDGKRDGGAGGDPVDASGADLVVLGAAGAPLALTIDGTARKLDCEPRTTLLALLRERIGITGPKEVCDRGACGACTVLVDGQPVAACMILAHDCAGKRVETVEGIGTPESPHPLQRAFAECDGLQCGFCTPGFVMSLKALLDREKSPSLGQIQAACAGNVCRCGTYPRVFEAAGKAAAALAAPGGAQQGGVR